jgi:predicted O-methyltransferase YrrM
LEIGTGLGYSTVCLSLGNDEAIVGTIDKDEAHITLARENCERFALRDRVIFHTSKAEDLLPKLSGTYDLIFYDGFTPQKKFVIEFERLLRIGGVALSTNLFLSNPSGGGYLKLLQSNSWVTKVEGDTAISVKF